MTFIGLFAMYLIIIIIIIIMTTFTAFILFLASFFMKKNYKKKLLEGQSATPIKKYYLIPRIIGWIFMIPLLFSIGLIAYVSISTSIYQHNSLGYHVMQGNYSEAEEILKKGIDPDCTLKSNKPANPGEQTLLSLLCEKGFTNELEDSIDDEETEKELKMIQLLIDYGADIESRTYSHDANDSRHFYQEESDYYNSSDRCGYTPFLYAVYMGNEKTVELLIENGADINAEDYCGYNAISIIADKDNDDEGLEMLRYLIDKGCDKDHATNYYQLAYFLAFRNESPNEEPKNKEILKLLEK
ncbi:MAG: hypothetical protein HDR01_11555 [Lachnospiraceae bacterium]|nr:hypothetical protein [Lachnospiraceae bacterium]